MTSHRGSTFVYVTFIRSTPEKVWSALTSPETMRKYWFNMTQESDWAPGSSWKMKFEDGGVADAGEILEADPPRRLVIKWLNEFRPELKAEGPARCTYEIEPVQGAVKLTIVHESPVENSKVIEAVSGGWPRILSNLKSWLETGEVVLKEK
jgi:uncharacterized protein YndB with AHSA1/START domain